MILAGVHEEDDFRAACPETKGWPSNPSLRYNRHTMPFGRIGCELAVVAVLCVLTIFFFPAMQGPYPVVHGPVTAFQAARSALRVQIAIVHAALNSQGDSRISPLAVLSSTSLPTTESEATGSPEHSTILRC